MKQSPRLSDARRSEEVAEVGIFKNCRYFKRENKMKKDDGGNVYAFASEWGENYGISRRDWLAGLAMKGLCNKYWDRTLNNEFVDYDHEQAMIAEAAYNIADAMIEEGKEHG